MSNLSVALLADRLDLLNEIAGWFGRAGYETKISPGLLRHKHISIIAYSVRLATARAASP